MGYLTATASGPVTLPLVVTDSQGNLYAATDARYQIVDKTGAIIRAFPASGSDFTALATGVLQAAITAPATAGDYVVQYEATVHGTLLQGVPDLLVVAAAAAAASPGPLRTGT